MAAVENMLELYLYAKLLKCFIKHKEFAYAGSANINQ